MTEEQSPLDDIVSSSLLSADHLGGLASDMVRVPSVNGEHPERAMAMLVRRHLEPSGFRTELVGSETRPSLAAVWGDGAGGLLLNGHVDTVPVDDASLWQHDPFSGDVADGKVHGRGACDMKGGLAVEIAVAQWLADRGHDGRMVLHFAMGEERGEPGTSDLIAAGYVAPQAVVLEPTALRVGIAQRGLITLAVTIHGRAGHASRPDLASNPIEMVPGVLAVIESLNRQAASRPHETLGPPAWTVTGVHAGVIPSMVPGTARLLVDRRMIPGESFAGVVSELEQSLATLSYSVEVAVVEDEGLYEPAEISGQSPIVSNLSEALTHLGVSAQLFGTPYSSDVRHLINDAGIEAVTFGPGQFAQMHARDEFVTLDDLELAARALALMAISID